MAYVPGRWRAICDVCGLQFVSDKLHKRWDGLMVCKQDMESRHPQDFVRVLPERIVPPWTRPEGTDVINDIDYLGNLLGIPGLDLGALFPGIADIAIASASVAM